VAGNVGRMLLAPNTSARAPPPARARVANITRLILFKCDRCASIVAAFVDAVVAASVAFAVASFDEPLPVVDAGGCSFAASPLSMYKHDLHNSYYPKMHRPSIAYRNRSVRFDVCKRSV
jgi:hypothetical protein